MYSLHWIGATRNAALRERPFAQKKPETKWFHLKHIKAEQAMSQLLSPKTRGTLFSKGGYTTLDAQHNRIAVTDFSDSLANIEKHIQMLDQPVKQFFLKVYLVDADQHAAKMLGITDPLNQTTPHLRSSGFSRERGRKSLEIVAKPSVLNVALLPFQVKVSSH